MGALPSPELPRGAHRDLVEALHDLHHRAGWPSLRTLARATGVSHTTVSTVFSSPKLPTWGILELVVEAMGGSATDFHRLWLAASAPADGATPVAGMAGRRDELIRVRRHIDSGNGLLLVTGEAGIGKTKLVTTAAISAEAFVASGACRPLSASVPLLAITDLLRHVLREHPAWFTDALAACPTYVGESLNPLLPELGTDMSAGVSDEWARQRLFSGIADLLGQLHERRPLGVLVEDAHWADPTTLDLLELLGSKVTPLVVTWRTDDPDVLEPHADWLARVRRLPGATALALTPLTREETVRQLVLLTGRDPTPAEVERIHARSLGQPLFTEQLALHPDDQPLPELLADLLLRRLRGLGEPAWAVARALGVADRPLRHQQLVDITGADPLPGLRELDAQRLLSVATGEEIRLRHPLVTDAIRARLVPGEAPEIHRRIATALATEPDPPAAEIAEHWAAAGDPQQELHWRIAAARAASARFAAQVAADQWQRVIDLWPDHLDMAGDPPVSRAGMLDAALLAIRRVDLSAALPHLDQAMDVAEQAPAPQAASLLITVANIRLWNHEPTTAHELNARAVALLEGLPPSADFVNALGGLQACLEHTGRYQDACEVGNRAVAVARDLGDASLLKDRLADSFWHESLRRGPAAAQALIEELSGIVVDPPDPYCELRVADCVTDVLLNAAAPAVEVAEAARSALAVADEWGAHLWTDASVRANVAEAQIAQGQTALAWDLVAPLTDGNHHQERWPLHNQRALLELLAGRTDEARRRLGALADGPRGILAYRLILAATGATIDVWTGRPRPALERALSILEEGRDTEEPAWLAPLLALAARAAADLGEPARAKPLLAVHAQLPSDPFAPHPLIAAVPAHGATWAAELARLKGIDTVDGWVAAAANWDRLSRPYDAAYARWRAAQVALRTAQGSTAGRLLKRAAQQAHGHVPLAEAIRRTAGAGRLRN